MGAGLCPGVSCCPPQGSFRPHQLYLLPERLFFVGFLSTTNSLKIGILPFLVISESSTLKHFLAQINQLASSFFPKINHIFQARFSLSLCNNTQNSMRKTCSLLFSLRHIEINTSLLKHACILSNTCYLKSPCILEQSGCF